MWIKCYNKRKFRIIVIFVDRVYLAQFKNIFVSDFYKYISFN